MSNERLIITGGPRTGKTTLGGKGARHCDDAAHLGWSEASQEVSTWLDAKGPWTIEGVAAPRALRKWLERNPKGKPCDRVLVLQAPFTELTKGQFSMTKGVTTVLVEIVPELLSRGVVVEQGNVEVDHRGVSRVVKTPVTI